MHGLETGKQICLQVVCITWAGDWYLDWGKGTVKAAAGCLRSAPPRGSDAARPSAASATASLAASGAHDALPAAHNGVHVGPCRWVTLQVFQHGALEDTRAREQIHPANPPTSSHDSG